MDPQHLPLPMVFEILLHTDDQDQWPPEATLLVAASHGNIGRLKGKLEGHNGFTALHTAAEKGRCAIAKFLLSRGAYIDGKSCHATPVHLAVLGGHDSTLKMLLDHNADRVDHYDAALFSNRSLCWLRRGDGRRAWQDAVRCKILRPKWVKSYFRQGQALMLMKDYEKACKTLAQGLELDPLNDELDKLYWEAMELKNGGTEAA
ncbi:hypothetical protein BAE44_0025895 [Dichanthelium oligosanthes]|uniref:Uncharacterized protein n=1 Tax=Dichanthelium oligosanthes TaxID=888268 RepID=A0A1E5UJX0_9POAL|nr:hypothetical protein BAE44_0025895 [Dichanthelium oligosanthes]